MTFTLSVVRTTPSVGSIFRVVRTTDRVNVTTDRVLRTTDSVNVYNRYQEYVQLTELMLQPTE